MRLPIRGALTALSLIVPNAAILAQQPPATTPKAATPKAATVAPRRDPRLEAPLAIANGEKVTRREVLDFLTTQGVPPGQEAMAYDLALNSLINTRLLNAFLIAQKVPVPPREVDAELDRTLKQLQQQQGTDLESAMNQLGITKAEIRDEIEQTLRWKTYLLGRATDAVLTKYILANKDAYSGAEVTASHILIKVDPDAPTAQKDAARQKLLDLKKDIESGKTTFADAANKISEDDMVKANQNGGDLGTFQRKRPYDERFSAAAFAQKTGVLSDPVETDYGEHLILVTKRKDGKPVDPAKLLQQYKGEIINQYGLDTQTQIVADQRKTAKIEMKPMPKDLFPPSPRPNPRRCPGPRQPQRPQAQGRHPPPLTPLDRTESGRGKRDGRSRPTSEA